MDNFFKNKNFIDPIALQCNKQKRTKMILYNPIATGGNTPNNVKAMIYSQYVRQHIK